jgi:hypothetical protein
VIASMSSLFFLVLIILNAFFSLSKLTTTTKITITTKIHLYEKTFYNTFLKNRGGEKKILNQKVYEEEANVKHIHVIVPNTSYFLVESCDYFSFKLGNYTSICS